MTDITQWRPSTCHCIAEWIEPYVEGRSGNLLKQCRSHDTFGETIAHERSITLSLGRTLTQSQMNTIRDQAIIEKKKPEFQRR